eukprot:g3368.t1
MASISSANDEALLAQANEFKDAGNALFKANNWAEAIEQYSKGIEVFPTAVLYSNRAFCFLKIESFGLAIADAKEAIKLDTNYIKGHYRLASAKLALGKLKAAQKIFKQVCKLKPRDRDARKKLKYCDTELRKIAFEKAIESEGEKKFSETVNLEDITVSDTYDGPRFDDDKISPEFVEELKKYLRDQKKLHRKYVIKILLQCLEFFKRQKSLINIEFGEGTVNSEAPHFNVCGDTHGQFYDVLNIFEINGAPSPTNPYLFNGDFVDRGSFSFEVVITFFAYKLLYPTAFYMARGNHETIAMNKVYGFTGEVKHKYDDKIMKLFEEVFQWLPLAHVINDKIFVTHGGLFKEDNVTLDDIRNVVRNREPPESGIMSDILWSDPQPFPGRGPSKRGVGLAFGPDITKQFLDSNGLSMIVRSHEVRDEGYLVEHDGKLVTVFSAPNYCDQMGNKGAIIKFNCNCEPSYIKFTAVSHPPIRPMAYAGNMFGF